MARGRMISNAVCGDKKINSLSDDTCRLLFTWLVTFADREGRVRGDAAMVRSTVFPRRTDIQIEQVEAYLQELHDAGLIIRYECADDLYIWFPKFDKNQPNMRKEREPSSELPPPTAAAVEKYMRKFAVNDPADFRQSAGLREEKRREVNRSEENDDDAPRPNIYKVWEQNMGLLTGMIAEGLDADVKEYGEPFVIEAIRESVKHGARSLAYVETVLRSSKSGGDKRNGRAKQTDDEFRAAMMAEAARLEREGIGGNAS